jgi:hypothetical protein
MRNLLISVLPLILASVSCPAQEKTSPAGMAEYSVVDSEASNFSALVATADGKTYQLIDRSKEMCLQVVDQRDFDGNGLVDALVENILGCGGNCCSNSFFFVSNMGGGRFEISDDLADSWGFPVIEEWKGRWSVVVVSDLEGIDQQRLEEIKRRFILESGRAIQVEASMLKEMESIVEIRSEIFHPNKLDETHSIEYDLDGDHKKDRIETTYGSRWGRMLWSVQFADGKKYTSNIRCKRIGVLETKTDGVTDLVCDQDGVFRWNGLGYQEPPDPDEQ